MGGVECPEDARYPAAEGKGADGPGAQDGGDGAAANGSTGAAAATGLGAGVSDAASEALEAFRQAVLEVRALRGQEQAEGAMEEAKLRLGKAMRVATAAGVSQADLVKASAAPAEEEAAAAEVVRVGDQAEIVGLESEGGKRLNGMVGLVQEFLEDTGRFRLELGPDNIVSIKPANLLKWPRRQPQSAPEAGGEEEAEEPLKVGDRVEIGGLESEGGKKLNGRLGWILEFISDSGRFKLELTPGEFVSVKPANLKRFIPEPPPEESRQRSASSSSSSSRERRKKKKEKKKKRPLTPEEVLENLVKTEERAAKKAARSARDAGAAAAAAAAGASAAPQADGADSATGGEASGAAERDPGCAGGGSSMPVDPALAAAAAAASAAVAAGNVAKAAAAAAAVNIQAGMQQQQQQQPQQPSVPPSAPQATPPAGPPRQPDRSLRPGDRVEVHGLQSAAGRPLNGKTGVVIKFAEDKGRWQVELGLANLQSLKPENLRICQAAAASFPMEDGYMGSTAGYTLL